jgi:hypothetical protein
LDAALGLPVAPKGTSFVLPLSVRLRVTRPELDWVVYPVESVDRCVGFRVNGPSGRLGTVQAVGFDPATGEPAWLQIRTGLFVRRSEAIPIEDVESIDPIRRWVTVTTERPSRSPR